MARNGSGVQSSPGASYPAVASTLIESAKYNAVVDDINSVLTTSLAADGQTVVTGNQSMNSFKHTSIANGTARTDNTALGQLQDAVVNWVVAGGTVDAITAAYSPAITALIDGQVCCFRASGANTSTAPTFAPNGLIARIIYRFGAQALVAGDIRAANHEVFLRYHLVSTRWELLNPATATSATSATSATNAANVGIADDNTTNAVMYPTWVTAAGGNIPPKVTSSKLSFNPSTGALASTSLVLSSTASATQLTSTIATGTAPLVVSSTTEVANLKAATATNATNATNATGSAVVTGAISSSSPTAGIGYAAGAGGSVTQATDKTTAVTLNKLCGKITTAAGSIAANNFTSFLVNNTSVVADDVVTVQFSSSVGAEVLQIKTYSQANGFYIVMVNTTASAYAGVPAFNFIVHKAVIA